MGGGRRRHHAATIAWPTQVGVQNWAYVAAARQLKITLLNVQDPPVWRRVLVPVSITLGQLHGVIAGVMGWAAG